MTPQAPFIAVGFLKRKPGLTREEFYDHWENKHVHIVAPWAIKHGIKDYSQVHTTPELRSQWATASGEPTLDFDGAGYMTFSSWDQFLAASADPYYQKVILVDEQRFLDKGKKVTATSTLGALKKILVDGKMNIELKDGAMEEWQKWEEEAKLIDT